MRNEEKLNEIGIWKKKMCSFGNCTFFLESARIGNSESKRHEFFTTISDNSIGM